MNMLIDVLPTKVKNINLNTDFRTSILFELLMQDNSLTEEKKVAKAIQLYYNEVPKNIEIAINNMLWFYKCGKVEENIKKSKSNESNICKIYSYEFDDEYIYSAFLNQYGIDLQDIKYLHWWKFKAMFKSLKEDNQIVKIMGYRSMKIDNKTNKEQRKYYENLKKIYALPDNRTEEEKEQEFAKNLSNLF